MHELVTKDTAYKGSNEIQLFFSVFRVPGRKSNNYASNKKKKFRKNAETQKISG